jgi:hypothetical protein
VVQQTRSAAGGRASWEGGSLRQHVLVKREVGDEPFQPAVFFFQLPEPPQFDHPQVGVLFLPRIERGVTDSQLSAKVLTGVPPSAWRRA